MQVHLTGLNAKITLDEEGVLSAEFDRVFSRESPETIQWAFQVWRDRSPFFPAVCDIRALILEFKRGQREQLELKARMDERFLLEERRKQGQVPDFPAVLQQLREIADAKGEPEFMKRHRQFNQKMQRLSIAVGTLHLSEEQIRARREKERAEIERYREESL